MIHAANTDTGFNRECQHFRIVCTNGMVVKTSGKGSRLNHISNRGLEHFPETMAKAMTNSILRQTQLQISQQTPIQPPIKSIESYSRRFGLIQSETEAVHQAYSKEPGGSMFKIINALTYYITVLPKVCQYSLEPGHGTFLLHGIG